MGSHFGINLFMDVISGYKAVFITLLIGYLIHWIPERFKDKYRSWFASQHYVLMAVMVVVAVFCMYQLMSGDMQPFIYFQF
jgi:ABC-type glycerol-3-phosphate transport system permease component